MQIFKFLDQYEGICRRAFFGCATKLNKNIKTNIIEILILIMCIPRKINFLQLGRYGKRGEQCYRHTFSRAFDWLGFNMYLDEILVVRVMYAGHNLSIFLPAKLLLDQTLVNPSSRRQLRSVRTSHHADPSCKGVDGNKKIKGRKEHIVVDTLGLPMSVSVHEANIYDSKGAPEVIEQMNHKFPRLKKILADGGYRGTLADWVATNFGWVVEIVLRPDECPSKFKVLPKRWIVERSFSWLENFRRLTIDYEYLAETAVAMVQIAFIQIMLNKFF